MIGNAFEVWNTQQLDPVTAILLMLLTVQVYRKRLGVIFVSLRVKMIRNKDFLLTNTITEFKKIYDLRISSFTFAWFTLLRGNCKNAWCTLEVMHLLILQFVC